MDKQKFFPTDRLNSPRDIPEEVESYDGRVIGVFNYREGLALQVGGDGFVMAIPYVRGERITELLDYFGAKNRRDLMEREVRFYGHGSNIYGIEKI